MRSSQQETRTRTRDLEPDWDLEYIVACHCHFLVPDITITLQVSFCLSLRIFNISMCWSVFSVFLTNSFIDHSSSCIHLCYRISSTLLERIVGRGRQWCPANIPPHWSHSFPFHFFLSHFVHWISTQLRSIHVLRGLIQFHIPQERNSLSRLRPIPVSTWGVTGFALPSLRWDYFIFWSCIRVSPPQLYITIIGSSPWTSKLPRYPTTTIKILLIPND